MDATLLKTPFTRSSLASASTVLNPKWVVLRVREGSFGFWLELVDELLVLAATVSEDTDRKSVGEQECLHVGLREVGRLPAALRLRERERENENDMVCELSSALRYVV